jgi:hypothetical protein
LPSQVSPKTETFSDLLVVKLDAALVDRFFTGESDQRNGFDTRAATDVNDIDGTTGAVRLGNMPSPWEDVAWLGDLAAL